MWNVIWLKALLCLASLCVILFFFRRGFERKAASPLVILSLFLTILYVDINMLWPGLIFVGLTTLVLILEFIFPRHPIRFLEQLESLVYFILKRLTGIGMFLVVAHLLPRLSSPMSFREAEISFIAQGLFALVVFDLKQYLIHRSQHGFQWHWRFHIIHHATPKLSALAMAPTNLIEREILQSFSSILLLKFFDLDPLAFAYFYALPSGVINGVWAHANLNYPRVDRWPFWAYIVNSPNFHAHHHTKEGSHSNFGELLAIWDCIFGTYAKPLATPKAFGVEDQTFHNLSFVEKQFYPFLGHSTFRPRTDSSRVNSA